MKSRELLDEALVAKAQEFAITVYGQRKRKGDEFLIEHSLRVKRILEKVNAPHPVIAAGLLHDTLEDTDATYKDLADIFGRKVARIVQDVTEQDKNLPWRTRKEKIIVHVATMGHGSLLVKAADKIDNLTTLCEGLAKNGPGFMKRFNAPLPEQVEMSSKLVEALKNKWPENPLLPDLRTALDAISNLPVDAYEKIRTQFHSL